VHRRYNDKLSFSNYLSLDILHGAYSFGDSIFFSLELAFNNIDMQHCVISRRLRISEQLVDVIQNHIVKCYWHKNSLI